MPRGRDRVADTQKPQTGRPGLLCGEDGHDMERYICGWNPTKDENIFGFWPDKFKGRDCRTWDWGGSMVVHQLIQQPDGNLGLALP